MTWSLYGGIPKSLKSPVMASNTGMTVSMVNDGSEERKQQYYINGTK